MGGGNPRGFLAVVAMAGELGEGEVWQEVAACEVNQASGFRPTPRVEAHSRGVARNPRSRRRL